MPMFMAVNPFPLQNPVYAPAQHAGAYLIIILGKEAAPYEYVFPPRSHFSHMRVISGLWPVCHHWSNYLKIENNI